jgi:hypothetical protein
VDDDALRCAHQVMPARCAARCNADVQRRARRSDLELVVFYVAARLPIFVLVSVAQAILISAMCRRRGRIRHAAYHATGRVRACTLEPNERTSRSIWARPEVSSSTLSRKDLPHRSLQPFAGQGREARP